VKKIFSRKFTISTVGGGNDGKVGFVPIGIVESSESVGGNGVISSGLGGAIQSCFHTHTWKSNLNNNESGHTYLVHSFILAHLKKADESLKSGHNVSKDSLV
jgi:hypothetical protein